MEAVIGCGPGGTAAFTKGGKNPTTYGKLLRENRARKAKGLPPLDLSR